MNPTVESKNKATALEALDTLFNKRTTHRLNVGSPNYIQHIKPGRDGLARTFAPYASAR